MKVSVRNNLLSHVGELGGSHRERRLRIRVLRDAVFFHTLAPGREKSDRSLDFVKRRERNMCIDQFSNGRIIYSIMCIVHYPHNRHGRRLGTS